MLSAEYTQQIRRWGWLRFGYLHLMNGLKKWFGLHLYLVRFRHIMQFSASEIPTGISIRFLDKAELHQLSKDKDLDIVIARVDTALAAGDTCAGVFLNDELVAYSWFAQDSAPHVGGMWVRVGPTYQYGYKAYTRAEHRGKGFNPAIVHWSDPIQYARGLRRRIAFVETHNFSSLGQGKKIDAMIVGWAGYFCWFGRFYTFRTPACRRAEFEFYWHAANATD